VERRWGILPGVAGIVNGMKFYTLGFMMLLFLASLIPAAKAQVVVDIGHRHHRHYRHHHHHHHYYRH
jgi:hypothetical protein